MPRRANRESSTTTIFAKKSHLTKYHSGNGNDSPKKYHSNKRIRYSGQFEAGREVGVFKFYSPLNSEHPVTIKTYFNNSDISKVQFYTVEGVLESEGQMKGRDRIGLWKYYSRDGKTLLSEERYENGLLHGISKTFYQSGQPTEILNYANNKLNGLAQRYDANGLLISDVNYKNGKLNGWAKYFTTEGKIKYQGAYSNDEKVGEWEYYENGKIKKVEKS